MEFTIKHAFKENGQSVHTVTVEVTPSDSGGRDEPPTTRGITVLKIAPPYDPSHTELEDLYAAVWGELAEEYDDERADKLWGPMPR